MKSTLRVIGIESIFDGGRADFSKMQTGDEKFFHVDNIIQGSSFKMDEEGTAATVSYADITKWQDRRKNWTAWSFTLIDRFCS